jgi:hypothetical protein
MTLSDRDRRTAALVFFALLLTYAYCFGGSGFSQNAQMSQARAIVERGSIAINGYNANTADLSHNNGRTYPNKPPGMSFLTAVPYALIHAVAGAPKDPLGLTFDLYLCTIAICGISGAALGMLMFLLAMRLGATPRRATVVALSIALGTPVFAYSTMLFLHVPSALLILVAFGIAAGLLRKPVLLAGVASGAATCINYLSIFAVIPIAILIAVRSHERRRDLLLFVAGGVPFALLLAAYQWAAFGSPMRTSIATTNPAFLTPGAFLGIFPGPKWEALFGITFSPYRGLFYIAPVLLLSIIGALGFSLTPARKRVMLTIAATFALFLLVNSSFNGWHGGYAIGPRYLIAVIPLLGLLLVDAHVPPRLFAVLAAISIALNFIVTVVDPQPPDGFRDPIRKYEIPAFLTGKALQNDAEVPEWIRTLYTGHTSTNRVASDEMLPFRHHPPGSPEGEWSSFNLGEMVFGAGNAASLIPLLAFWLVTGVVLVRRTREPA